MLKCYADNFNSEVIGPQRLEKQSPVPNPVEELGLKSWPRSHHKNMRKWYPIEASPKSALGQIKRKIKAMSRAAKERSHKHGELTLSDRNAYYEPHRHEGPSAIMIVSGQLTIKFPDDKDAKGMVMKPGDMVDIDAGRLHEVWTGADGCTTVNGN